ncbi:MAG: MATE family efflux transporter [Oscillospiraceae bacterium]|jgi:putative MATE family efflux protein|nr:MATE family efflux transporter [Oscillospiraceae bacterium]
MQRDLTAGSVTGTMLRFAAPMIAGNLLQQLYNIADTLIVGQFLGSNALGAVGSAFTLMTFLTSILLGLCMGSGTVFAIRFGQRDMEGLREGIAAAFALIAGITVVLNIAVFVLIDPILRFLRVHPLVYGLMRDYLYVIFFGIAFTFLYNFFACLLRSLGNSAVPLAFLAFSALLNIGLDLWFVLGLQWGVKGAAAATVIAQGAAAAITVYTLLRFPHLRPRRGAGLRLSAMGEIGRHSVLTCVQQSVMNFGILLVQGVVNSFGPAVMAAFAAAVKIDAFAYMPVQDFGNAFSTFVAQNYGAGQHRRIRTGIRQAAALSMAFSALVSAVVFAFARPLMGIFVQANETEILDIGVEYLHIEGAFYCGIALLFLLYGLYRALERPGMSVVLTVISLGTRVALAYALSPIPAVGVLGVWWAVPIGWFLADLVGVGYFLLRRTALLSGSQVE